MDMDTAESTEQRAHGTARYRGRPKGQGARPRVEITIQPELLQQVRQTARTQNQTVSTHICSALTEHLTRDRGDADWHGGTTLADSQAQATPIATGLSAQD